MRAPVVGGRVFLFVEFIADRQGRRAQQLVQMRQTKVLAFRKSIFKQLFQRAQSRCSPSVLHRLGSHRA